MSKRAADAPVWDEELTIGDVTFRGSVDILSDGTVYSTAAMEPASALLRQMVMPMTREDWMRVHAISERAIHAIDRVNRPRRVA